MRSMNFFLRLLMLLFNFSNHLYWYNWLIFLFFLLLSIILLLSITLFLFLPKNLFLKTSDSCSSPHEKILFCFRNLVHSSCYCITYITPWSLFFLILWWMRFFSFKLYFFNLKTISIKSSSVVGCCKFIQFFRLWGPCGIMYIIRPRCLLLQIINLKLTTIMLTKSILFYSIFLTSWTILSLHSWINKIFIWIFFRIMIVVKKSYKMRRLSEFFHKF